jgi:hypothetical protein
MQGADWRPIVYYQISRHLTVGVRFASGCVNAAGTDCCENGVTSQGSSNQADDGLAGI